MRHRLSWLALASIILVLSNPFEATATELLVTNIGSPSILGFDGVTGAPLGPFGSAACCGDFIFGPDGSLYVAGTNQILRYDGLTGRLLGVFATVKNPQNLAFGPDGNLYVSSFGGSGIFAPDPNEIVRINGTTGASMGTFAPFSRTSQPADVWFGTDGNLYVHDLYNNDVLRFDGRTGSLLGNFWAANTTSIVLGPNGNLYGVAGSDVLKFDGTTGALLGTFASGLGALTGLVSGPDGNLYVSTLSPTPSVLKLNGTTGSLLGTFASGGDLTHPTVLEFDLLPVDITSHVFSHNVQTADGCGDNRSDPCGWQSMYAMSVSNKTVNIDIGIHLVGDDPGSALLATWKNAIQDVWSNSFGATDGRFFYDFMFDASFVTSGGDFTVSVHSGTGPENMLNWYTDRPSGWPNDYQGQAVAHEFGHMLGLFDEYCGGAIDPTFAPNFAAYCPPGAGDPNSPLFFRDSLMADLGPPQSRYYQDILANLDVLSGRQFDLTSAPPGLPPYTFGAPLPQFGTTELSPGKSSVPVPPTIVMLLVGLVGLLISGRRWSLRSHGWRSTMRK